MLLTSLSQNRERDMQIHTISETTKKEDSMARPELALELEEVPVDLEKLEMKVKVGTKLSKEIRSYIIIAPG